MLIQEMLDYAKKKIKDCEELIEFSKTTKVDRELLRVNEQILDFYKSVLPLIEQCKETQ